MPDPYEPIVRLSPHLPPTAPPSPPAYQPRELWYECCGDKQEPRSKRPRSEATWAAAREDYEIGMTAEHICGKLGLSLSTFRTRARKEGWRREDQALAEDDLPPDPEPEDLLGTEAMIEATERNLSNAVRRGRVYEARAWMKLAAELRERLRSEQWRARTADQVAKPAPMTSEEVHAFTRKVVAGAKSMMRGLKHAEAFDAEPLDKAALDDGAVDDWIDDEDDLDGEDLDDAAPGEPDMAASAFRTPGGLHPLHPDLRVQSNLSPHPPRSRPDDGG